MTMTRTTNRRAVLGIVLAAGAAVSTAAIPAVAEPAPDQARTATAEKWAAREFEPLAADTLAALKPPSNEELHKFTDRIVPLRLAWLVVGKTKDELKEIIRNLGLLDGDAGTEMIESISNAADLFEDMAGMLAGARARCLCVASVLELEEART